jgi:hypothetical protein
MVAGVNGAHGVNVHALVVLEYLSQSVSVTIQFQLLEASFVWVNVADTESVTLR